MNLYAISLAIGAVGFLAMALTGLGRHGHAHARGPAHGHGHAHVGAKHTHQIHASSARASAVSWLWSLTSPRVLFSLLIGFGTTGLVLRSALSSPLTLAAAVAGGLLFEQLFVGPVWNFLMRFASAPALTLESVLQDEVQAVTGFTLAFHRHFRARDGRVTEHTGFVPVASYQRLAEVCGEALRKGSPVLVEGRLQMREWTTREGRRQTRLEIRAELVHFLEKAEGAPETASIPLDADADDVS